MSSLISNDLPELEEAIKQLRIAYEKYFAGVERVEPAKERENLRKQLHRLMGENTKNTARRFRIQGLNATLVTYEQHWNRITRQIEEGTFKRDKLRAERILRGQAPGPLQDPDPEPELDEFEGDETSEAAVAARPATPPPPAARPPAFATPATVRNPNATVPVAPPPLPVPSAKPIAATSTSPLEVVRQLHQSYVSTRQAQGERDPVTLEAFASTLQKQAAAIKARFGCREVEFKVAVKDGKTILKATPR